MSGHTPGPWTRDPHENFITSGIANVATVCHHPSRATSKANALLIAAAPDLLEALRDVLECYEYPGDIQYQRIRDVIAKATGGE